MGTRPLVQLPPPPVPGPAAGLRPWSRLDVDAEATRLARRIAQPARWSKEMCRSIAPLTLEINALKDERDALILAHSYQTPDIVYGVADKVGDSYGLSVDARDATRSTIVFSSVRFMAETAKIVNPDKTVLVPRPDAGCSLADGITRQQVLAMKREHPGAPVMCYVNTTAAVKAASDVCCTSSNYLDIARRLPGDELIFVPDRFMGMHLAAELAGKKKVHVFQGACEVHEQFDPSTARAWREAVADEGRDLVILAHPECAPNVLAEADFIGSTEKMMEYAKQLEATGEVDVMPITECGTADRMRAEMPGLRIHGACVQCPHMKKTGLVDILQVLQDPRPEQVITIPEADLAGARGCLDQMFAYA